MPTVTINEINYKKIIKIAGKIQIKENKCISVNDVVTLLLSIDDKLLKEEIKEMKTD